MASYELSSKDFLEFEVGTNIVGDVIETAKVGSNAGLDGEVVIEAIAGTKSHSLFGVVAADSSRNVELADVVRLEETIKSSLRSKALLHLVIETVNAGIDGLELSIARSLVLFNESTVCSDIIGVRLNVGLVRGDVVSVRLNVGLVRRDVVCVSLDGFGITLDQIILSIVLMLDVSDLLILSIINTRQKVDLFLVGSNICLIRVNIALKGRSRALSFVLNVAVSTFSASLEFTSKALLA